MPAQSATLRSPDEVEVYLGLICEMLADVADAHPELEKSLHRDAREIRKRVQHEGVKFLTESLPKIGKFLDQRLLLRGVDPPPGFKRARGRSYPEFLQGIFSRVLTDDGVIPEPCTHCIGALRQIAYTFYKLDLPYDSQKVEAKINAFIEIEEVDLAAGCPHASSYEADDVRVLFWRLLRDFDHKKIVPRHGPGAVESGEALEEKWAFKRLFIKAHQVYPYYDYFVVGSRMLLDRVKWYKSLKRVDKGCSRMTLVPKDSRGPRVICIEPLELQYLQQGLMVKLVHHIENHPLTRGQVNFTRQEVNQELALTSSKTGSWATLDMKDASDRVSEDLVWWLFGDLPEFRRALLSLRSEETKLPSGRVIKLRKYASMGSALCFPVEALCFWGILVSFLAKRIGLDSALKSVFVYGDDIVIPSEYAQEAMAELRRFKLEPNEEKSCWTGFFRESCGVDAYLGVDVTPARLKKPATTLRPQNPESLLHYTSFANLCRQKGFVRASNYLRDVVNHSCGLIPYGDGITYPCWIVDGTPEEIRALNMRLGFQYRWKQRYQQWEILCDRVVSLSRPVKFSNCWHRLQRNLQVGVGDMPDWVFLPRRNRIRRGWAVHHGPAPPRGLGKSSI